MREVTKSEFKDIYFRLGGGRDGWDAAYWNGSLEHDAWPGMKYMVEEPETPQHVKMMIVTDFGAHEHRLFFMTQDGEDDLLQFPGD
jgi:hypothetical protein